LNKESECFAEKVKTLMKQQNMSQAQIAKLIGIDNSTVCRYLGGSRIPNISVLKKMADVLGTTIDSLIS